MYDYGLLSLNKSLALSLFFYESKYWIKNKNLDGWQKIAFMSHVVQSTNSKLSDIKIYTATTYSVKTHKLSYLHLTLTSDLFYY